MPDRIQPTVPTACPARSRRGRLPALLVGLLVLGLLLPAAPTAAAGPDDEDGQARARRKTIRGLGKKLGRLARSPYRDKKEKKDEAMTLLDGLETLGSKEAAEAALRGVAYEDEKIRNRIFLLVRKHNDPELVKPLGKLLLEEKDYRRDFDLKERIARALGVMGDPKVLPILAELIRGDMDAKVVAAACDSIAAYPDAPVKLKKPPVEEMIGLFAVTWNYMKSVNPAHKIEKKRYLERYKVYGTALRAALEALTKHRLRTPVEWRRWWNDNKKARTWKPPSSERQ